MNPVNIHIWSDSIIHHWISKKIELAPGTSLESISNAENILQYEFPDSFKALYKKANGFEGNDWTENMISIWPISRILNEYGRYPEFIGFSDFLLNSHVYGFLKGQEGIFKNYDLKDPVPPVKIADTFEEVINHINTDSNLLY